MTPYYADDWLTVYLGDCRTVMSELPAESVHCVVTSPPYWGLRDYGTATWEGGDEACDHKERSARGDSGRVSTDDRPGNINPAPVDTPIQYKDTCRKCGARRIDAQLGLEPTPEAYVESMVAVFREVKRVLRSDGTVWLNLGDSYAGSWGANGRGEGTNAPRADLEAKHGTDAPNRNVPGLKPKDLVGIPWRVAFALQADGWYLRSDIIWSKPNPMPESVTDRPTKAHEYLFLLSKSARYYFDADAVREESSPFSRPQGPNNGARRKIVERHEGIPRDRRDGKGLDSVPYMAGRNLRSVWTIATQPYPGAHFATFPRKLVEPCVKAGTSERGVCPECGSPWVRVVERGAFVDSSSSTQKRQVVNAREAGRYGTDQRDVASTSGTGAWVLGRYERETTGWRPSCGHTGHEHDDHRDPTLPVPATVLDPFAGSGTTAMVAQSFGRKTVLIDLNGEYLGQVMERNRVVTLGLSG